MSASVVPPRNGLPARIDGDGAGGGTRHTRGLEVEAAGGSRRGTVPPGRPPPPRAGPTPGAQAGRDAELLRPRWEARVATPAALLGRGGKFPSPDVTLNPLRGGARPLGCVRAEPAATSNRSLPRRESE